jgi:hypothetical protein
VVVDDHGREFVNRDAAAVIEAHDLIVITESVKISYNPQERYVNMKYCRLVRKDSVNCTRRLTVDGFRYR